MQPGFWIFPTLRTRRWAEVNLEAAARADFPAATPNPALDPAFCGAWVQRLAAKLGADCSWGGWLEDRAHLWRGHYLPPGCTVHLGIDFNVPQGTPVLTPIAGEVVHAEAAVALGGDWGGWCVLRLQPPRHGAAYLLFAHLAHGRLPRQGETLRAGDLVGEIGSPAENGGWYPHLHLQALSAPAWEAVRHDPGVALDGYAHAAADLAQRYPDPALLLGPAERPG